VAPPRRVLAIGWFGEANLGDEAMLEGLLRLLRRALGPIDAIVTSGDPGSTSGIHGVRAIRQRSPAASGWRNMEMLRACLSANLVTLGGGDLLREQANGVVPARNWLARMRVPLALRRPSALLGVSVGELFSPDVVEAVAREVRRFGVVAARDGASAARLAELSGRPVATMGDLALEALDPLPPKPAIGGATRIGVATRSVAGRGPAVPESATTRLNIELAGALDAIVSETGAAVELIPFRAGARNRADDDELAGEALASGARTGARWIRHPAPRSAADFGRIAADLDLVVAVRLHGAVLGAAAGRRVIGVAYDPKVTGFLADLGVADQALALDASSDSIAAAIRRSLADDAMETRIRAGVVAMRELTQALEPRLRALAGAAEPTERNA
jgi:polysaccharide pyruvyl transferase WcaK-like protein